MILKDNFYTILRKDVDAMAYDIRLNPAHTIYQAHFPGEPVTPGVCILQIARELLEDLLQRPLAVKSVKNMKFLSVISPLVTPQVSCCFEKVGQDAGIVSAQATIKTNDKEFVKLSFTLTA